MPGFCTINDVPDGTALSQQREAQQINLDHSLAMKRLK